LIGRGGQVWRRMLLRHWYVVLPTAAVLAQYALVLVTGRYAAPFAAPLMLAIAAGCYGAETTVPRRAVDGILKALALMLCVEAVRANIGTAPTPGTSERAQVQVADQMPALGASPGARVAMIGDAFYAYWARLARVQITSEIPPGETAGYWNADDGRRAELRRLLATGGARVLVTDEPPRGDDRPAWQPIGATGYYVRRLSE
jgi:hypothetical protein